MDDPDRGGDRDLDAAARRHLGLDTLRPGQREALTALLGGHDTLAVMPTGAGKSAIYQLAGAMLDGATVVISPLVALQQDQVRSLRTKHAGTAVEVNSVDGERRHEAALVSVEAGGVEFVLVAPEQLANAETMEVLADVRPSLFVIDEAHCISAWGHDFRPAYLRLGRAIDELGHPLVVALTATASPPVRRDIVQRLGLRDPVEIVTGFDRPNLYLAVHRVVDDDDADDVTEQLLRAESGATLVYVRTRARAEALAARISSFRPADPYHAGLPSARRRETHRRFLGGATDVVVATSAFGMGIDKADVRLVVHPDGTSTLDDYHQQIGRAGRGAPARAVMLHRPEELSRWKTMTAGPRFSREEFATLAEALERSRRPLHLDDLAERVGVKEGRVALAVTWLEEAGQVTVELDGRVQLRAPGGSAAGIGDGAAAAYRARRIAEATRIGMVQDYAEAATCRRVRLLGYLGQEYEPPCGNCDRCDQARKRATSDPDSEGEYRVGTIVVHAAWGRGEVLTTEEDRLTVLFEEAGYRNLSRQLVDAGHLLRIESAE